MWYRIGIQQHIIVQIRQFLLDTDYHRVNRLNAVGFVSQASHASLTLQQKDTFNSIFSMPFDDYKGNITVLITFTDGQYPTSIPSAGNVFQFNHSALYTKHASSRYEIAFNRFSWNASMQSFQELFAMLREIKDDLPRVRGTQPPAPGRPIIQGKTDNSVTLKWNEPQEDATVIVRYVIHCRDLSHISNGWTEFKTSDNATSATVPNLKPNTTYEFSVSAHFTDNCTSSLSPVSDPCITFSTRAPSNVRRNMRTLDSIKILWDAPHNIPEGVSVTKYYVKYEATRHKVVQKGQSNQWIRAMHPHDRWSI